jgi:hypothetical protein
LKITLILVYLVKCFVTWNAIIYIIITWKISREMDGVISN